MAVVYHLFHFDQFDGGNTLAIERTLGENSTPYQVAGSLVGSNFFPKVEHFPKLNHEAANWVTNTRCFTPQNNEAFLGPTKLTPKAGCRFRRLESK